MHDCRPRMISVSRLIFAPIKLLGKHRTSKFKCKCTRPDTVSQGTATLTQPINAIPFATSSLSGTVPASQPITAFNENWVWGGAAQLGATYAFAGGWFLDVAYSYARSANFIIVNPAIVFNQIGTLVTSSSAVLNAQEQVTNQPVTLTLNYKFH